jgi:hypothetical protein
MWIANGRHGSRVTALAALLLVTLLGCGESDGALEASATGSTDHPTTGPAATPSRTATPVQAGTPRTGASGDIVTDRWEQVPSLDGSPPAHESDIHRAIDTALADPDFDGWLGWFEEVAVTQVRSRGDGILVRAELDPHLDPAIAEHRDHGYPTDVCFVGRDTDVIAGVVWLVGSIEESVIASSPIWADGTNCALW